MSGFDMRERYRAIRRHPSRVLLPLWIVLVVAFFTWQAGSYRGVVALLAEWQFNEFGVYHPLLTFLLFILLLAPLPYIFTRRRRKPAVAAPSGPGAVPANDAVPVLNDLSRAILAATRFLNVMAFAALGCLIAALIAFVMILMLPSVSSPLQRITASATVPEKPAEGFTEIHGNILYTRTSAFDEDLWLARRNVRFAPMIDAGADQSTIRYFIELSPTDGSQKSATESARQGILVKKGLPGEIFRLYRYAGFTIAPTHYVLFRSVETMRWPYLVWMSEFGVAGVLIGLGALVQWFRRRRLLAREREVVGAQEG